MIHKIFRTVDVIAYNCNNQSIVSFSKLYSADISFYSKN